MSYYTTQKEISFGEAYDYSGIIPDAGASVQIEFWNGNEWVIGADSPVTFDNMIYTRNNRIRFTPTNGGYHIDEGAAL